MSNYDASNARKTPLGLSLNQFAQKKIADDIAQLGGQLPCQVVAIPAQVGNTPTNGQVVTVSFEINSAPFTLPQVSMPIATWLYDWIPVQVGDVGLTVASDVYLGGISGLGGGSADLSRPGNLASLLFLPVANAAWGPPGGDANMRVVQGPDGVLLQDLKSKSTINVSFKNGVTITTQNLPIQVNDSGGGSAKFDGFGFVTVNAKNATVNGVNSVNLYAPNITAAASSASNVLPLKRSDGSNTTNLVAS